MRLPGSEAHLPARYSNEGSTVNGKTGCSTGDSRNHNQKYITAVKISLSCHHPQHFTDITCPAGEAVWSQGPVTAFSSKVCKSHCRALGKSLTSLHFSLQQLLRKRNGERGMPFSLPKSERETTQPATIKPSDTWDGRMSWRSLHLISEKLLAAAGLH